MVLVAGLAETESRRLGRMRTGESESSGSGADCCLFCLSGIGYDSRRCNDVESLVALRDMYGPPPSP